MSLYQKYKKSLNERWCMRFKTNHPDSDEFDGVITHIAPKFIVLYEVREFEFDGIVDVKKSFRLIVWILEFISLQKEC